MHNPERQAAPVSSDEPSGSGQGVTTQALANGLKEAARAGARALIRTALGVAALGVVLLIVTVPVAAGGSPLGGAITFAVVLFATLVVMFVVAFQRGVAHATATAVAQASVGSRILGLAAQRLPNFSSSSDREPTDQFAIERAIKDAVVDLRSCAPPGLRGWLARAVLRRVEEVLLAQVKKLPPSRLSRDFLISGVGAQIDAIVASRLTVGARYGTWVPLALLIVGSVALGILVSQV